MRHALALAVGLLIALVGAVPVQAHVVSGDYREDVTSCAGYDDCTPDSATADETQESDSSGSTGGGLDAIAQCESEGDPTAVSPDGQYRGLLQFDRQTWESVGGTGDPAEASSSEQLSRGAKLYAERGAAPWPLCGR
jgi:hypothetical protein